MNRGTNQMFKITSEYNVANNIPNNGTRYYLKKRNYTHMKRATNQAFTNANEYQGEQHMTIEKKNIHI